MSASNNSSNSNNPWAWLGLLKWSLSYADGTTPSDNVEMSAEDKAFLEAVMAEGIVDENDRMKTILQDVTTYLERWRTEPATQSEEESVDDLLQELRDIAEQIDYARAFAAMKGLGFLLGCVQEDKIPLSTKTACLGLMATVCQHNPPVQKELLELGSLRILSDEFFRCLLVEPKEENAPKAQQQFQAKLVQAISANVRSFELAEAVFCQLEQAPSLMVQGLQTAFVPLRKRALFFLRALLTSDTSEATRVQRFATAIAYSIDHIVVDPQCDAEVVEMALSLIVQLLEKQLGVDVILSRKSSLVGRGVPRVSELRKLTGDDAEMYRVELELWERCIPLLARTNPTVSPVAEQ